MPPDCGSFAGGIRVGAAVGGTQPQSCFSGSGGLHTHAPGTQPLIVCCGITCDAARDDLLKVLSSRAKAWFVQR